MLKMYDYLEEILATQRVEQTRRHQKMVYYASEVIERMGEPATTDFSETLFRTFKICAALDVPIDENFKKIYRFDGEKMIKDWLLSPLACYLLMVNGNPMNPAVAKVQLFAAFNSQSNTKNHGKSKIQL